MVELRDLTKTLSLRSIQISATESRLLIERAARELAERSGLGAVIVPLCFAVVIITSGYASELPLTWICFFLVMLGSSLARRLAILRIRKQPIEPASFWLQLFYWACLGTAAIWGMATAIFIYCDYGGFPVLLVLVFSAGIGAGAMLSFCIWRALAVNYLLLSFGPGIIAGACIRQTELWPAIIGLFFFVVYLIVQTKHWNFHFWDSLITAYLFERQAEKLSEVNSRLAENVEKEQQLRKEVESSRGKVRELFNLTNDAIIICSLDGRILDVNLAMQEMFSGAREEILASRPQQLLNLPESSELSVEKQWQKVVDGQENDFECRMRRSGERDPILVHVNLRRVRWQEERIIFITLRDVTARKEMEEALQLAKKFLSESEGYLWAILRNVELPIYCKDLKGCYLTVNKPFEQLCCKSLEELRGKNDLQVFQENLGRFFCFRDAEIVAGGGSLELEGTFNFGGQEKNLLVHKFPLKEKDGTIYATAGICTDVTTMKKALRTAQLANEAKSEFLANMSHELRTPMHSILSIARLGLKRAGCTSREKLESYFEMIVASGDQLLELLSDLLDLSTLESAKACYSFREYDLVKDVDKVINEFKVMMDERHIRLSYYPPASPAPARYDRTKIYQVLRNLLANAMKFTGPEKEVRVVLQKDTLQTDDGRYPAWKVMVIDQGVGVEKDELELVFGKFVKGSKSYRGAGGVGLGLSICKRIIEDHHGIIWAERNHPEGTSFCFLLPALD